MRLPRTVTSVAFAAGLVFAARQATAQAPCHAPVGADLAIGDITSAVAYAPSGGLIAYSFGSIFCNLGDIEIRWDWATNQHPILGQSIYRLHDGRFEQIGLSWAKHAYSALVGSVCCSCSGVGGSLLGVGCSSPYTASRNGAQSSLGPRWPVNPSAGYFPYPTPSTNPPGEPPPAPSPVDRRLQVRTVDIDPALNDGAAYLVELTAIAADDARAGNGLNNTSYRLIRFPSVGAAPLFLAPTVRARAAVHAWHELDPGVTVVEADLAEITSVPEPPFTVTATARFYVAARATPLSPAGPYRYVYAVENINADRAAGSFSVPVGCRASVSQPMVFNPPHHSGDLLANDPWMYTPSPGKARWAGPQSFAQNPYASAIRWGTTYTFAFVSDAPPAEGTVELTLFRPSTGSEPAVLAVAGLPVPSSLPPPLISTPPAAADVGAFVALWFASVESGSMIADADCSGTVDPADLAAFVQCWLAAAAGHPCPWP